VLGVASCPHILNADIIQIAKGLAQGFWARVQRVVVGHRYHIQATVNKDRKRGWISPEDASVSWIPGSNCSDGAFEVRKGNIGLL